METLATMPKYDAYKDSGEEWLGDIPKDWEIISLKHLLKFQTGGTPPSGDQQFFNGDLSWVTIADLNGVLTNKTHTISRKGVKKARIPLTPKNSLLYSFKLSIGQVAFAHKDLFTNEAIASFLPTNEINLKYYFYVLPIFLEHNAVVNIYGAKLLNQELIKNAKLLQVRNDEQTAIANFLNEKTTQIDEAIAIKEKQIDLLKERKQIIIQKAVTQGLNPNVPMKDSGVDWIGQIPEHWEVMRSKYLFKEIDERSIEGNEELLSVSHLTGVTPRSEKSVTMIAEDYSGSKTCQENDLIMNIMWAWMGALGVSDRAGIVSSAYSIYRQISLHTFNPIYLEWLLKTTGYIEHYNKVSTGLHSSRLRFYSRMFFDMEIGFPECKEQNQIVEHVEEKSLKIDNAIELQGLQVKKLKEYKTTLINSAVTGKIKVA